MRKLIANNALLSQRIDRLEDKLLVTDSKLEQVFKAIEDKNFTPQTGIFFEGQIFDAYVFISKLIKQAKRSILLIDNYVDESVLTLLSKRSKSCKATIYTKNISNKLQLDLEKHNEQYAQIEIKLFPDAHDRFLILDDNEVYHIGASLKDLGKKWFAFSRLDKNTILEIFKKLKMFDMARAEDAVTEDAVKEDAVKVSLPRETVGLITERLCRIKIANNSGMFNL